MITVDIELAIDYNTEAIKDELCRLFPMSRDEIGELCLLRRNLVLKNGAAPYYKCKLAFSASEEREAGLLKIRNRVKPYEIGTLRPIPYRGVCSPVIVGAGPAGLFSALLFAESGADPIIIERGLPVEQREKKVALFNTLGILDPECNVQFGEGGAGTFSDGKLKVGGHDIYKDKVLCELISAGADPSVFYADNAHLGTDKLPTLMRRLRQRIISLGGRFIFGAKLCDLDISDGQLRAVKYIKEGREEYLPTDTAILAIGHSARDTIRMLKDKGLTMEARGFGIGMRVEHPREYINDLIYKESRELISDTASYHLVTHLPSGRSVYSFCMCPGGTVVGACSEEGGVVTNGMSRYDRMADNSNAAILVSVTPNDFPSDDPLSGIELQRSIERAAYSLTGGYKAPVCSLSDLLGDGITATTPGVKPSYERGVELVHPGGYLPRFITESLASGFSDFDKWIEGFALGNAALTGPETRTTSPVRILRAEGGEALGLRGVYPIGEGAGYSGGIISSAVDGLRIAHRILTKNQ